MDKIDIIERIRELNTASEAYYNTGYPIMSDAEYDKKLEELKYWEEETGIVMTNSPLHNVGTKILESLKKVKHESPMLSLDKVHSIEEIKKFANGRNLVASIKMDGISCRLVYQDGDFVRAESRGNGLEGNDITEAVKLFENIPSQIHKHGKYVIDGEAFIKLDDFDVINKNKEYKNSRNLTAGTLVSLDLSVVRNRKLRWYAWEVVENSDSDNSFASQLREARKLGFRVVPHLNVNEQEYTYEKAIESLFDTAAKYYLPQDGIVFKFDDITYGKSLGSTSHHFNNGIAYKIFNDSVETTLKDIEWSMGKTGSLCPTAVFKPVEIYDTIVERASLSNLSIMKDTLGNPYIGQKIMVSKRNMIIPKVESGVKKYAN